MMACNCKTKKELKVLIGTDIRDRLIETSMFGKEYKPDMQGVPIVGPGAYQRKWYAQIWVKDNMLWKVK